MTIHEKPNPSGTAPQSARPLRIALDGPGPVVRPDSDPDPQEREVVDRARDGDGDAFRELVEQHHRQIYRLAMRVLNCDRNTAEDVCQEVFLRAFRGLPRFDGGVRFGAWLHTIAMNACISEYRKRRALKRDRRTLSIDAPIAGEDGLHIDPPSSEIEPSARADQREFALAVREAVAELPEEFRHAVLLRDMQNLSYEEIAGVLGVPPGTVRSRIHRGRVLLQQLLGGFEP